MKQTDRSGTAGAYPARGWTTPAIVVLAIVVLVGAAAFMLLGVGAELSEWRDVRMTVVVPEVLPEVAEVVSVGDVVYTDPAAMQVGVVAEVLAVPMPRANPDASGELVVSEDPIFHQLTVVIETKGRESAEIIAIGNQVVQVGMEFAVVSKVYQLEGWIVDVDVR